MEKYLVHYGIKGQKRGVRRWTNADGTLTEAGKKRYYDDSNGNDYKPGKFVDERTNYTPTRHYMQYMSDHGGTSGRINPPKYSGFSEEDKGRNNRYEFRRRREDDKYGEDARTGLNLHMDRRMEAPFRTNSRIRMSYNKDSGTYKIDHSVRSRLDEYRKRQTARESTLQAPGSDRMERANIADSKGPYMSKEYREELAYNSQKNTQPYGRTRINGNTGEKEIIVEKRNPKKNYGLPEPSQGDRTSAPGSENLVPSQNDKIAKLKKEQKTGRDANLNAPGSDTMERGGNPRYVVGRHNFPNGDYTDVMVDTKSGKVAFAGQQPKAMADDWQHQRYTGAPDPSRYGKNDTATTARKSTTTASTTVSTASKSSSLQKGLNFIKKLFSK